MRTTKMPGSAMNPKQYTHPAGSTSVRGSHSPAPFSQPLYRQSPVVKRGFRGSLDWCPYPGLF
jgi:hypothetical protein